MTDPPPVVALTTWARTVETGWRPERRHTLDDRYTAAVQRTGAVPMMIGRMDPSEAASVLDRVDGLLVTGGPDLDPTLYGQENTASRGTCLDSDNRDIALVLEAQRRKLPVLGICRGLQAVNVALGGELHQHMLGDGDLHHPDLSDATRERESHRHKVSFLDGCRLSAIYGANERDVNSLHHQAISRLAPDLVAVGHTPGGAIEAVESTDSGWPLLAVQWHPERLRPGEESALFNAFAADARDYRNHMKDQN